MNSTIHNIVLDLHASGNQAVIPIIRGDTNRKIIISLVEGGRPYAITEDCVAYFSALKEDGNYIYNDTVISIESNSIVYDITEQTSACVGVVVCQIKLINKQSGAIISTPMFSLIVENLVYNEQPIVNSSVEFNALTRYIAYIEKKLANGEFKGEKGDKGDTGEVSFKHLDKALKPFPKLSANNPNGISGASLVAGYPSGDGTLWDTGVHLDDLVDHTKFANNPYELIMVNSFDDVDTGNPTSQLVGSGIRYDDVQQKSETMKFIASVTLEEPVQVVSLNLSEKPIYKEFLIRLDVPAASGGSNTPVTIHANTTPTGGTYCGYIRMGIAGTRSCSWYRGYWRGSGWEGYCCQAQGTASVGTLYSMPKYPANGTAPIETLHLRASSDSEINWLRAGTNINVYGW